MSKYNLNYHRHARRRRTLDEHPRGPWLRLGLYALGLIAALAVLSVPVVLRSRRKGDSPRPVPVKAEVAATPAPTATPVPMAAYTGSRQVLDLSGLEGQAVIEPHVTRERILFVSGPDASEPHRLYEYDLAEGTLSRLQAVCRYDQLRHPVENETYLVYLDVSREGRGEIRVREKQSGEEAPFVGVQMDAPSLFLEENYLAYTARTGEDRTELYLMDLENRTGITLARFVGSTFGASLPDLAFGKLVYGDMLSVGEEGLVELDLASGRRQETPMDHPVQNPRLGEGFVAFETGLRSPGLAALLPEGKILLLTERSEAFAVCDAAVIYQQDRQLFAAEPLTGIRYALTDGAETADLLAAGDGLVLACVDGRYEIFTLEYTYGEG